MNEEAKSKRRKLLKWVLVILIGWIAVVVVESQIVKSLDRKIRADSSIFQGYVDWLPDELDLPRFQEWRSFCERKRAWGLWEYQICIREVQKTPECISSPAYIVSYWHPPNNTIPYWKSYHFGMPFDRRVFTLNQDKSICQRYDLSSIAETATTRSMRVPSIRSPKPIPTRPATGFWRRAAEGARACMIELGRHDPHPGALLMFRMRERAIAKHVGILTDAATMIHARERLGVIEEPFTRA